MSLEGKSAIVTGSTSGIGQSFASAGCIAICPGWVAK